MRARSLPLVPPWRTFAPTSEPSDPTGVLDSWSYDSATGIVTVAFDGSAATSTSGTGINWRLSTGLAAADFAGLDVLIDQVTAGANTGVTAAVRYISGIAALYGIGVLANASGELAGRAQVGATYTATTHSALATAVNGTCATTGPYLFIARANQMGASGRISSAGTVIGASLKVAPADDGGDLVVTVTKNDTVAGSIAFRLRYRPKSTRWNPEGQTL